MTLLKRLFWGGLALALTTAVRADSVTYGTIADAAKIMKTCPDRH